MSKPTAKDYIVARPVEGVSGGIYWYEITGFTEQQITDSIADMKTAYPDHNIYRHPNCTHIFRSDPVYSIYPESRSRCGTEVLQ